MAKFLKDIVKPKSTKVTNDLGGYAPKAGDEQDFAKKHEIEKHDDRNGNGDDVFKGKTKYVLDKPEEKRHGYKKPEDAKVNESKKAEDVSCNHTPAGTKCPVHEMADCTGSKTIKEEDIDETMSAKQKQYANRVKTIPGKKGIVMAKSNFEAPVHKVHAVISKNGGAKETVKHELQAKDKHDAMFTIQMMHHKAGDKVHDTKYKGIKEEVEQIYEVWYVQHKDGSRTHHESGTAAMKASRKSPGSKVGATHGYGGMKAADALKPKTTKEEVEQVDEISKATLGSYINKSAASLGKAGYKAGSTDGTSDKLDPHIHTINKRSTGIKRATDRLTKEGVVPEPRSQLPNHGLTNSDASKMAKVAAMLKKEKKPVKEEAEQVDEVLTKSTTAGETIHDFVHSKNPKFAGKSKKERQRMALGAYYAKQRNEETITEVNNRDYAAKGKMHPDMAKSMKVGQEGDFYAHGTGDKVYGKVTHNNGKTIHIKQSHDSYSDKKVSKTHKFTITPHLSEDLAVPLLGGDPPRGDSEEAIEMVKSELKALANKAMHLVMQMPQGMHVEPWCQAKIAQAKSYVSDVHDYMIYGDHEDEKDEQMDTPLTFPNMSVDVNTGQNV